MLTLMCRRRAHTGRVPIPVLFEEERLIGGDESAIAHPHDLRAVSNRIVRVVERNRTHKLSPACPRVGDVLVSPALATPEYDVRIVPNPWQLRGPHGIVIANAVNWAQRLGVDAWLTEDRTHFIRFASYRRHGLIRPD